VKFILQIRVGLLQARAILEKLHQPLFILLRSTSQPKLVDQDDAFSFRVATNAHRPAAVLMSEPVPPLGAIFQPFI